MSALPDPDRPGQARADEPALVARALAGDRAALGALVEAYAGSVRRITRAILGNVEDAEDAAQDGLLAALVKLDRYDPTRPFGPWLLRIAANAAIDRRRRRTVRQARVLGDDLAGGGPLPDAETERLALGDRLRAALDELPEHYRAAVVLFDVEGYSHARQRHERGSHGSGRVHGGSGGRRKRGGAGRQVRATGRRSGADAAPLHQPGHTRRASGVHTRGARRLDALRLLRRGARLDRTDCEPRPPAP